MAYASTAHQLVAYKYK